MSRNFVNHIINLKKVKELQHANRNGQLQQDDLRLLTEINGVIPTATAPFNTTDFNNKEAVGAFIDHVEKMLSEK